MVNTIICIFLGGAAVAVCFILYHFTLEEMHEPRVHLLPPAHRH